MDEEARRKFHAKRFNEHIRLLVTSVNAIGLVIFGAGVLQPLVGSGQTSAVLANWIWVALSITLHLFAQSLIRLTRPE